MPFAVSFWSCSISKLPPETWTRSHGELPYCLFKSATSTGARDLSGEMGLPNTQKRRWLLHEHRTEHPIVELTALASCPSIPSTNLTLPNRIGTSSHRPAVGSPDLLLTLLIPGRARARPAKHPIPARSSSTRSSTKGRELRLHRYLLTLRIRVKDRFLWCNMHYCKVLFVVAPNETFSAIKFCIFYSYTSPFGATT